MDFGCFRSAVEKIKKCEMHNMTFSERVSVIERYEIWCEKEVLHDGLFNLLVYLVRIQKGKILKRDVVVKNIIKEEL